MIGRSAGEKNPRGTLVPIAASCTVEYSIAMQYGCIAYSDLLDTSSIKCIRSHSTLGVQQAIDDALAVRAETFIPRLVVD